MADVHDHSHDHGELTTDARVAKLLRWIVAGLAVLTVVGLVVWRPGATESLPQNLNDTGGERVTATVVGIEPIACAGSGFGVVAECEEVQIEVTEGTNAGNVGSFELFPESQASIPPLSVGDRIVVIEFEFGDTGDLGYAFADYQRARPLILLGVLFVVAVVALGRFQGFRAIGGLVVSAIVLFFYVFPALLGGQPPLPVALVSASVIAFAALYLAHGVNDTTTVALLGTMAALVLTGVLGAIFISAAKITGLASEDQIYLLVSAEGIDLRGLVLAGIVLGSLGVLDDVTVTQVSAVARLREANPDYTVRDLYRKGVTIGRDHIASTVNTLVLAYAGASLPLLLFYSNIGLGFSDSVTSEVIAVEVIRTLVGSIGLVSAVPLTTLLAALVVTGTGLPALRSSSRKAETAAPAAGPDPDDPTPDAVVPADSDPAPGSDDAWEEFTPNPDEF